MNSARSMKKWYLLFVIDEFVKVGSPLAVRFGSTSGGGASSGISGGV